MPASARTKKYKKELYWVYALQASPFAILIFLFQVLDDSLSYFKIVIAVQLLLGLFTLRIIKEFSHISGRIWMVGSFLIPLPMMILCSRLLLSFKLIGIYYLVLVGLFISTYLLRRSRLFISYLFLVIFLPSLLWIIFQLTGNEVIEVSAFNVIEVLIREDISNVGKLVIYFIIMAATSLLLNLLIKNKEGELVK